MWQHVACKVVRDDDLVQIRPSSAGLARPQKRRRLALEGPPAVLALAAAELADGYRPREVLGLNLPLCGGLSPVGLVGAVLSTACWRCMQCCNTCNDCNVCNACTASHMYA